MAVLWSFETHTGLTLALWEDEVDTRAHYQVTLTGDRTKILLDGFDFNAAALVFTSEKAHYENRAKEEGAVNA